MPHKTFVEVVVRVHMDGEMTPLCVIWEDGRKFTVDRVWDVHRAASLKAGGQGMRYRCSIAGKQVYLFYEAPKWFIEAKD